MEWMGAMKGQQYVYDWVKRLIEGEVESYLNKDFGITKKPLIDSDSNDIYDNIFNMYQ